MTGSNPNRPRPEDEAPESTGPEQASSRPPRDEHPAEPPLIGPSDPMSEPPSVDPADAPGESRDDHGEHRLDPLDQPMQASAPDLADAADEAAIDRAQGQQAEAGPTHSPVSPPPDPAAAAAQQRTGPAPGALAPDGATDVIIRCRGVKRHYFLEGETVQALRGVDLDIFRGEYLSIMGPSGSGKSTLFNMVGGLDLPTEGVVELDGYNVTTLGERKLAWLRCNRIGYIFQSYNLLATLTATENVSLPLVFGGKPVEEAEEAARKVLERVGLGHRVDHKPDELSGGQRQRVAVARALANNPNVILADEPTGNLDLKTGAEILKLLKELQQEYKATIICATHDHKMLAASDRVVWIRDGQIDQVKRRDELDISVGTMDGETIV